MGYAVIGLVLLLVGVLVAAIVMVTRLRDRIDGALKDLGMANVQRAAAQREQASAISETLHLRSALREAQRELEQLEQEAADAGNRDLAGVAQRLRGRLSETGV